MSTTIKTSGAGKAKLFCAKDVFEALNIRYHGVDSIRKNVTGTVFSSQFSTKVGGSTAKLQQYALTEGQVKRLANAAYVNVNKLIGPSPKGVAVTKALPTTHKSAKLVKNDPLQIEARKQIREHVQDYASKYADQIGIKDQTQRATYYDLSFKALYNAYKLSSANKLDLKQLADTETAATGKKVSGLQIAERLGVAIELLQFAKSFYN